MSVAEPETWPHAEGPSLTAGPPGAWDDGSIFAARIVRNLDGSMFRDAEGYAWITYLASSSALQIPSGLDNDRPGLYRTRSFESFEKVTTEAPFLTWGEGEWTHDGSCWDGRVVQCWSVLWDGEQFVAFYA